MKYWAKNGDPDWIGNIQYPDGINATNLGSMSAVTNPWMDDGFWVGYNGATHPISENDFEKYKLNKPIKDFDVVW